MKQLDKCAQVVIVNPNTKMVLGVSRKDDHNDFGLAGGKYNQGDVGTGFTAKRELLEETGFSRRLDQLLLIHKGEYGGMMQYTYSTNFDENDVISTDEPHVVKWCTTKEIMNGSFGDYNEMIFKKMGLI